MATSGDTLYLIDTETETETAIGTMPSTGNYSLEFAGDNLWDFSVDAKRLMKIDHENATRLGDLIDVGVEDLRSIIVANGKPKATIVGYD